jgi:DNA invertase Pin-like site-specific DNA recombinase
MLATKAFGEFTAGFAKPAAQYVRMSTDMQQYSIKNQQAAIALYAAARGLKIVRSYEDAGKSGLGLSGRPALKALLHDVEAGGADFQVILVYDVSRWGRFQDADESAYYEFICKRAGVTIEYCAEQFDNDGSIAATIIKNIKRAMAGEFSRELSTKVFAGQSRIAGMGFYIGPNPGLGLRRFLVDENGIPKIEMKSGQKKAIKTDRTILGPGPQHELELIRFIFHLLIDRRASLSEIARTLNAKGYRTIMGLDWTGVSVRNVLANEKYAGTSIYGRTSKKLSQKWRRIPQHKWITKPGAFEGVVSLERFQAAQRRLKEITGQYSDFELLAYLTATWCCRSTLTRNIIEAFPKAPSCNTYRKRFGSLADAYRSIGFRTHFIDNRLNNMELRRKVCTQIISGVEGWGGAVRRRRNCRLRINDELTASVVVGRQAPSSSHNRWRFGYRSVRKPDLLIVARVEPGSQEPIDYYVLPYMLLPRGAWLTVSGINYNRLERFRYQTLDAFYPLCGRQPVE